MDKPPKPKRNKRRMQGISHVGGAMVSDSDIPSTVIHTNPNEISDEEVKTRRTAREDREDIAAAFPSKYWWSIYLLVNSKIITVLDVCHVKNTSLG